MDDLIEKVARVIGHDNTLDGARYAARAAIAVVLKDQAKQLADDDADETWHVG